MDQPVMRGAVAHPLVQRILTYQGDIAGGRLAQARTVFAPDVTYVVPGNNVLSGTFHGPDAVMGYFGRLMALTDGTYRITEMSWLASDDQVLLETRNSASRAGRSLSWDEGIVFRFEGGVKKEIRLFQADQAGVDAFFGNAG